MFVRTSLVWHRDQIGYQIVDHGKFGKRIVPRSGKFIQAPPLNGTEAHFFANVSSEIALTKFASSYGLLRTSNFTLGGHRITHHDDGRFELGTEIPDGEDVDELLSTSRFFKQCLISRRVKVDGNMLDQGRSFGEVSISAAGSRAIMIVEAASLMDALWLQLLSDVSAQSKFRQCLWVECRQVFKVGSSSGLRSDAKFCCERHRMLYHSRRR